MLLFRLGFFRFLRYALYYTMEWPYPESTELVLFELYLSKKVKWQKYLNTFETLVQTPEKWIPHKKQKFGICPSSTESYFRKKKGLIYCVERGHGGHDGPLVSYMIRVAKRGAGSDCLWLQPNCSHAERFYRIIHRAKTAK